MLQKAPVLQQCYTRQFTELAKATLSTGIHNLEDHSQEWAWHVTLSFITIPTAVAARKRLLVPALTSWYWGIHLVQVAGFASCRSGHRLRFSWSSGWETTDTRAVSCPPFAQQKARKAVVPARGGDTGSRSWGLGGEEQGLGDLRPECSLDCEV